MTVPVPPPRAPAVTVPVFPAAAPVDHWRLLGAARLARVCIHLEEAIEALYAARAISYAHGASDVSSFDTPIGIVADLHTAMAEALHRERFGL
jgi:hypothetical protein